MKTLEFSTKRPRKSVRTKLRLNLNKFLPHYVNSCLEPIVKGLKEATTAILQALVSWDILQLEKL
jgi:hypothetical protein